MATLRPILAATTLLAAAQYVVDFSGEPNCSSALSQLERSCRLTFKDSEYCVVDESEALIFFSHWANLIKHLSCANQENVIFRQA